MSLLLYNSLTRRKEKFTPVNKASVRLYSCGPTVYDFAHIGNMRSFIFVDLLKRLLKFKKLKVKHQMNITDVDDKTIKASKQKYPKLKPIEALLKYTREYEKYFWQDLKTLNIKRASIITRATEYISEMQDLILMILKNGYAYEKDGSIYFNVKKYAENYKYGQLLNIDMKGFKDGQRIDNDEYDKESIQDFVLWKGRKQNEPAWDFNNKQLTINNYPGRPGWHIECSAMSYEKLGMPFDIHTGGIDLKFPHHENEICQNTAGYGIKRAINFWLHNDYLLVDGEKMSKSKGNFYTLRDVLKKEVSHRAVRYLLLSTHYRKKLNFTFKGLKSAQNAIDRIDEFIKKLLNGSIVQTIEPSNKQSIKNKPFNPIVPTIGLKQYLQKFEQALDDDLNISKALAVLFDLIKKYNKKNLTKKQAQNIYELILKFDEVLGLGLDKVKKQKIEMSNEVKKLIAEREQARLEKNFKKADEIREELQKLGHEIRDEKL